MIVTFEPGVSDDAVAAVVQLAERYPGVVPQLYQFDGASEHITELHLVGDTVAVPTDGFESVPGVRRVVRVSTKYRIIGRHRPDDEAFAFEYNGVRFARDALHVFAGLCAVDTREHIDAMMRALAAEGVVTTRMGAYKPRTSPYDFQGLGAACLPWVFELAGRHGIKVVAMEVTHARHIDEIVEALERAGEPTGVMLQIGTRNAQNFELLKVVGQQDRFPVLFKRGMGLSLDESFNAAEYVANHGNPNIVFCLRGVKTHLGEPHRNLVDFAHVPVVLRQTRLPVCIDPSHSVGRPYIAPDGLPDVFHAIGQGVIAGASMVLVDFHPHREVALCDGPQALRLQQLPALLAYTRRLRETYTELVAMGAG